MLEAKERGISADQVDLKNFDPDDRLAREVCHHLSRTIALVFVLLKQSSSTHTPDDRYSMGFFLLVVSIFSGVIQESHNMI